VPTAPWNEVGFADPRSREPMTDVTVSLCCNQAVIRFGRVYFRVSGKKQLVPNRFGSSPSVDVIDVPSALIDKMVPSCIPDRRVEVHRVNVTNDFLKS